MTSPHTTEKIDTTPPAIAQASITHPAWCNPTYCDITAGADDVHHCSTPITWDAQRDDAELSVARYQYAAGATGYLVSICNTGIDEHVTVLFTDEDFIRLLQARDMLADLPVTG